MRFERVRRGESSVPPGAVAWHETAFLSFFDVDAEVTRAAAARAAATHCERGGDVRDALRDRASLR